MIGHARSRNIRKIREVSKNWILPVFFYCSHKTRINMTGVIIGTQNKKQEYDFILQRKGLDLCSVISVEQRFQIVLLFVLAADKNVMHLLRQRPFS